MNTLFYFYTLSIVMFLFLFSYSTIDIRSRNYSSKSVGQPKPEPKKTEMVQSQFTKNLSKFRLITFDVTNTLFKLNTSPGVQYAKTASSFGFSNLDHTLLDTAFRNEFKKLSKIHPNFGSYSNSQIDWRHWWTALIHNIFNAVVKPNIPPQDMCKIAQKLISQYRTNECWHKVPKSYEIIKNIQTLKKTTGIISNFDKSLHTLVEKMDLPKFDFILTSYELGYLKPNKKIFQHALELSSKINSNTINPQEALHIGDTLELDYIGARSAGWSSLLISTKALEEGKANKNHVFETMEELMKTLEHRDIIW